MKLQGFKRIITEDVDAKYRSLVEKIGYSVNIFCEQVFNIFQNNINIDDNLDMQWKDIIITVDSNGIPINPTSFKNTMSTKCRGISVERVTTTVSPITGNITSVSAANPTVITSSGHRLTTGNQIIINNSNSVPIVDGSWNVFVLTTNTFSIPINVTSSGNSGAFTTGTYLFDSPFIEYSEANSIITINHITGLKPNVKYTITLLAKT